MRSTVTLDLDVQALLKKAMRQRDISFKAVLNDAVRAGLDKTRPRSAVPKAWDFASSAAKASAPAIKSPSMILSKSFWPGSEAKIALYGPSVLVLRCRGFDTNESDGFGPRARRKPQRYPLVSRGFATTPSGRRRGFMYRNFWIAALARSSPAASGF